MTDSELDTEAEGRARHRHKFTNAVNLIYLVAGVLLFYPALAIAGGIQSFGDTLGWWKGDPNSDQAEGEAGFTVGVIGLVIVLTVATISVHRLARRYGMKTMRTVLIGTGVLVVFWTAIGIWLVTTPAGI